MFFFSRLFLPEFNVFMGLCGENKNRLIFLDFVVLPRAWPLPRLLES